MARCNEFEVPCGPVNSIFRDLRTRGTRRANITFFKDPRVGGAVAMPNVCPRLSDTPGSVNGWGPSSGTHDDDVYKTLLGLSDREIGVLQDEGVI